MSLQHVPFGLSTIDNSLVDVADVKRGKQCGCICPSCQLPLIAKQGESKQWHFAHSTRDGGQQVLPCDFSFFVSVRMMAKQLMAQGLEIDLPAYSRTLNELVQGATSKQVIKIANKSSIDLTQVKIDTTFADCSVDIEGKVGDYTFVIYFTHPSRALPHKLADPPEHHSAVLQIKLDDCHGLFREKANTQRQLDQLKQYLQHELDNKAWVFHPRQIHLIQQAKQNLAQQQKPLKPMLSPEPKAQASNLGTHHRTQPVQPKPANTPKPKQHKITTVTTNARSLLPELAHAINVAPVQHRTATYECIMCHCQWQVKLPSKPSCPKCRSHLYAKECV
ncbi:competence protein CoiA family protein [Motilimonas sp. KMU-193]|uniref:competence protein CoiA family protein n=1 Tax=Motilimonas sp. KMU-193 TaxID=3388668 RepID=UPI00396AF386